MIDTDAAMYEFEDPDQNRLAQFVAAVSELSVAAQEAINLRREQIAGDRTTPCSTYELEELDVDLGLYSPQPWPPGEVFDPSGLHHMLIRYSWPNSGAGEHVEFKPPAVERGEPGYINISGVRTGLKRALFTLNILNNPYPLNNAQLVIFSPLHTTDEVVGVFHYKGSAEPVIQPLTYERLRLLSQNSGLTKIVTPHQERLAKIGNFFRDTYANEQPTDPNWYRWVVGE